MFGERFNEKIIHIGDEDYTMKELLVIIPERYTDIFRKVRFENISEFSQAVMFARCGEEARFYNKPFLQRENEVSLNWFLQNRPLENGKGD